MPVASIREEIKQTRPFASKAEEALVALIRTADVLNRMLAAVLEPHGITPQQYNVLRILRGAGDAGLPTLDIAERMIEQTPGITRLIDRLEAKTLAARERCLTDRRQVFCRITPAGRALVDALDPPMRKAADRALENLSRKDLAQLVGLLDRTREGSNSVIEEEKQP